VGQRVFHSRHIGVIALLGWLEAGEIGGGGVTRRQKEKKYSRNMIFWEKNENIILRSSLQKSQNNLGTCVRIPYRGFPGWD